jgi:urease accessory protein
MAEAGLRAAGVRARGSWSESAADTVVLDFDDRHRRRITMTGTGGLQFLLDLPNAVMLRSGDALVLEDGRLVEVLAAPEPLAEIRGREASDLVRLAWHVGNRHVPAQILPKAIRIRRDHVIEDMVRSLGAKVIEIEAPFDPEGGAYAVQAAAEHEHGGHGHHDHGHHHAHGHEHHDHGHKHHAHDKDHDHKAHDHGHKHDHGDAHGHHDH